MCVFFFSCGWWIWWMHRNFLKRIGGRGYCRYFYLIFFFCFLSGYKRDDITVGSVFLFCFPFGRVDKITETTNRFFLFSIENRKIFFFFFCRGKKLRLNGKIFSFFNTCHRLYIFIYKSCLTLFLYVFEKKKDGKFLFGRIFVFKSLKYFV